MIIIWSEKAGETFQKNIDYLLANWSENESRKFTERVFQYLDTLASEPFIARKTFKTKHTYIGVIIPQISIIYRIKPKTNVIELVTFIDNRRSNRKNKRLL